MKGNERLTTSRYAKAMELQDLPESAKAVVSKNHADEQRHLAWINDALARKSAQMPRA